MKKFIAIGILVILVGVVIFEVMPTEENDIQYGVSIHNLNQTDVNLIKNLGTNWVRSDVGGSNWQNVYALAKVYNFKILGILDYSSVPYGFTWAQWNESVYQWVDEYTGVNAWEIWNEPFANYSFDGYQNGSPYHYFNMTKSAYMIIKSINPKAEVIALGGYFPSESYYSVAWFNTVFSLGISEYSNAISLHLYPTLTNNTELELQYYNIIISTIKSRTSESIWVTETGSPASIQKEYINIFYSNMIKDGIKHIFWYDLYHEGGSYNTALVNGNGSLNPGYYALQNFINNNR